MAEGLLRTLAGDRFAGFSAGSTPSVVNPLVITAMDADVIKTYVGLGLGVGIVASIAFDDERDRDLRAIDARHLFEINLTKLAVRRGAFLRSYVYDFIETFASSLKREVVERAMPTAPGTRIEL